MKNKYITPKVEIVLLEANQEMMAGDDWTNESGISGFPGFGDNGFETPTMGPNGTVVNNNGAPTFVPGGNGGGGRQTPLG